MEPEAPRTDDPGPNLPQLGLSVLAWSYLSLLVVGLIVSVLRMVLLRQLDQGWTYEGIGEWLRLMGMVETAISLLAWGLCLFGVRLYARVPETTRARGLSRAALGAGLLLLVYEVASFAYFQLGLFTGLEDSDAWLILPRYGWLVHIVAEFTFLVLLLLALGRVNRTLASRIAPWALPVVFLVLIVRFGLPVMVFVLSPKGGYGGAWLWSITTWGLVLTLGVAIFTLLRAHARQLRTLERMSGGKTEDERLAGAGWQLSRLGLVSYRTFLLARLGILVAGMGLLIAAMVGKVLVLVKGSLLLMAMGGLIAGGGMLFGLVLYTRIPSNTGARGWVSGALASFSVASLLDFYGLYLVGLLLSEDPEAVRSVVQQSPYINSAGQALGLAGLILLLSSFKRVGLFVGNPAIPDRAGRVIGMLVVLTLVSIGVQAAMSSGALQGPILIPIGVIALGFAIVTLLLFLGILRDLIRALGWRQEAESFD